VRPDFSAFSHSFCNFCNNILNNINISVEDPELFAMADPEYFQKSNRLIVFL
jgi:hypothetical protein